MPRLSALAEALIFVSLSLVGCSGSSAAPGSGGEGGTPGGSHSGGTGGGGAVPPSTGGNMGPGGVGSGGSSGASNVGGTPAQGGTGGSAGSGGGTGGGSAGTAGGAGAPGSAGSAGAGASCAGALVCDDFEKYTDVPGMPWTVDKNGPVSVAIDTMQHQSGMKSVKFTTQGTASYQRAYIRLDKIFPITGNAFYGRMMIFAKKAANDGVHWTMIQGDGPASMGVTNAHVRYGGQQQQHLMANYDSDGVKSDCWQHSQTKMPEGKWACMEWYFDGPNNTQKFWLDGTAITDLTVTGQGQGCLNDGTGNKWIYPTFQHVFVGWESYQNDDPREIWIDDVAIGTSKIGCP